MGMNIKPDLTYQRSSIFICFFPETDSGKIAWNEIAEKTNGTGKILPIQLDETLYRLRKAGYIVHKAPKVSKDDLKSILEELE